MSMPQSNKLDILVSGAGIAGCTVAHFLLRAGHRVTIVERAPALRVSGQSVDVRGHGATVVERMNCQELNVSDAICTKMTNESGLRFVDASDASWADFPVEKGQSFTSDIEIMRGDLVSILFDSIKHMSGLEMVFDASVTNIMETGSGVEAELDRGWSDHDGPRQFDLVVAADGIASAVRSLTFPDSYESAIKSLQQWSCWFSIPRKASDGSWARWFNARKGRMILLRPDNQSRTRASLWAMSRDGATQDKMRRARKAPTADQKQVWRAHFHGMDWESERVLADMLAADDFYMQEVAQVKIDTLFRGRAVFLGDAGCCPSPITGMGTTTALVGAYVLAGEINTRPEDVRTAFVSYEQRMWPFVKVAQELGPGAPGVMNPESAWGIWALHRALWFVSKTRLYKLFGSSVHPPSQAMDLPLYST